MNKTQWFRNVLVCLLLAGVTLAVFWPVGRMGFINYDDHQYVFQNPMVSAGLTPDGVRWAFTTTHVGNWHPLTWLSHMLDCQLFGLDAGAHHRMNLFFHVANTLLLFIFVQMLTGAFWRSALVAALFALHPVHIQSVAWVSERKDLLSGCFFLLTLMAYIRYVALQSQPVEPGQTISVGRSLRAVFHYPSAIYYLLALFFFACGLMSKPMLVTVPLVMLLLDFWPLGRLPVGSVGLRPRLRCWAMLVLEKWPFLLLSLGSSAVTVWAQHHAEFVVSGALLPWHVRGLNCLVFYTQYLGKLVWPVNLSFFYPYTPMHLMEYVCSISLPIAISALAFLKVRSCSYFLVGWLWFLIMLVPVIGLVQVGMQAIADRYTYLPSIGLFILLAWSLADIGSISIRWRNGMILGVIALLLACLVITRIQLKYWKDEIALFSRSVEINSENNLQGYYLLGHALWQAGNLGEAAECYRALLRMAPANIDARRELIAVLIAQKRFAAAKAELLVLLQFNPDAAEVMNDLAWISATCPDATVRDGEFAVRLAERACMLTEYKQALLIGTLAAAYAESGQFPAAVKAAQQARAMALAQGQNKVAASNEKLLEIYESGRAYHENERDSGDGF